MASDKTLLFLGASAFSLGKLKPLTNKLGYNLVPFLSIEDITLGTDFQVNEIVGIVDRMIDRGLDDYGEIHGVLCDWDFPAPLITAYANHRLGRPVCSLESVLSCENKYLSRLAQADSIAAHIPEFRMIDPTRDEKADTSPFGNTYPLWMKPIKSFASHLGFKLNSHNDFTYACDTLRRSVSRISDPFGQLIQALGLSGFAEDIPPTGCLVETFCSGRQCTLEGFAYENDTFVYGAVETIRYTNSTSFARYQYPADIPELVISQMTQICRQFLKRIRYTHGPFNAEFIFGEDGIYLIEVNPRISRSHTDLFEKVDGQSNHAICLDLALGRKPIWHPGQGRYRVAAKLMLRSFHDGVVTAVPDQDDLIRLQRDVPGTLTEIHVQPGTVLSRLPEQDPYSFNVADIYLGGDSTLELEGRIERIMSQLHVATTTFTI